MKGKSDDYKLRNEEKQKNCVNIEIVWTWVHG